MCVCVCVCVCVPVQDHGCSEEMVTVVSLLSVDSVLFCPASQREKAMASHIKFHSPHGDHMTLLAVYLAYCAAHNKKVSHLFIHVRSPYIQCTLTRCGVYTHSPGLV